VPDAEAGESSLRCASTEEARDRVEATGKGPLPSVSPCLCLCLSFSFSALARTTATDDDEEEEEEEEGEEEGEEEEEREENRILASSRASSLTSLPSTASRWGTEKTAKSSVCCCVLKGLPSMRRREREESLDRRDRSRTVDSRFRDSRRARKAPS
jgi:hypothetical protein